MIILKIRKFTTAIASIVIILAIWCMTPPETSLPVKFLLTSFLILLHSIGLFCRKDRVLEHLIALRQFCHKLTHAVVEHLQDVLYAFASWCCEADLDIVESKCTELYNSYHYLFGTQRKSLNRPIRRVRLWSDLTALCSIAGVIAAGVIFTHYQNLIALIFLNLSNIFFIGLILMIITYATTISFKEEAESTDPILTIVAAFFQVGTPIVQLAVGIGFTISHAEIVSYPIYEPFFEFHAGYFAFSLSPLQLIIIVSAVLFLVCYGNLCSAVHDLVHSPMPKVKT